MTEPNITPGTWRTQEIRSGQYDSLGGFRVYSEEGPIVSRVFRRADSRLISVAPKLLESLEGLKLPHGCYCPMGADKEARIPHSDFCRNTREVLARARGEPWPIDEY